MTTAAIYCRVSTPEQREEGSSLQSQLEACLEHAANHGFYAPESYCFLEDASGATLERPLLEEVRVLVRRRELDGLLCYSQIASRGTRSTFCSSWMNASGTASSWSL